jgi:lycopene cyclase domain-containing protein
MLSFLKKWGLLLLAIGLVLLNWFTADIKPNNLVLAVNPPLQWAFFETHNLYLYLHLLSFIPVFALSFDKKVAYHRSFLPLFKALLIVSVIFWIWDIAKTDFQVWGFNPRYYHFLLVNLPIEEWFFFITFPFCSVFIYECLNAYFPKDSLKALDTPLSILFGMGFVAVGFWKWESSYTATTWLPAGLFALWHLQNFDNRYRTLFYRAFFVGLIPFFLVNSVLTGATTAEPVVIYNPEEFFGVRLGTVPIDDFVYNFLLQFMVLTLFEHFRSSSK